MPYFQTIYIDYKKAYLFKSKIINKIKYNEKINYLSKKKGLIIFYYI